MLLLLKKIMVLQRSAIFTGLDINLKVLASFWDNELLPRTEVIDEIV